jgi:PiT family inorganic phosphate transporter
VGAGFVSVGAEVNLAKLGTAFVAPLLASPILSFLLAVGLYPSFRFARRRLRVAEETCLCVGPARVFVPVPAGLAAERGARFPVTAEVAALLPIGVSTGTEAVCLGRYGGRVLGVSAQGILDAVHYLSAGAVCFARALNDTPKLVGLLAIGGVLGTRAGLLLAGLAVTVGGLLNSRRVAETMSRRAVSMNSGQGFTANLVTSALALAACFVSLPVSTTHVSCGAIFGIGAANRTARPGVIAQVLLAWVTTLPLAAALSALAFVAVR